MRSRHKKWHRFISISLCRFTFYIMVPFFLCSSIVSAKIINVPGDQPTIQGGIFATSKGDTVLVAPGRYKEKIGFGEITVGSYFLTTQDTSYISQTIIDGSGYCHMMEFIGGHDSTTVLAGFTIADGYY